MSILKLRQELNTFFDKYALLAAAIVAFLIPLKLLAVYIVLIPLLCLWVFARGLKVFSSPLISPFLFFLAAASVSALLGLNPLRSFRALISLAFFSCSIPFFSEVFRRPLGALPLITLLSGQALASFVGLLQAAFKNEIYSVIGIDRLFLGRIAESGQIALTLVLALGILLLLCKTSQNSPWKVLSAAGHLTAAEVGAGIVFTCLIAALGFSAQFPSLTPYRWLLLLACLLTIGTVGLAISKLLHSQQQAQAIRLGLCTIIMPTIIAALLVNLKRGPWLGIAVAATVLLLCYERRVVLPLLLAAIIAAVTISPIRSRLAQSSQDFFIYGGRNVIWQIGAELAPRYPFGIGYKNSRILRQFSFQVPPELTHFHNNVINILVETGWIAFAAFALWIINIIRCGLSKPAASPILGASVACAILSWQVAGIVEYNAGDSEVLLVVYMLVGLLSALVGRGNQRSLCSSNV